MACTRSANHNVVALALALMLCAPTVSPFSAYAPHPLRLPLHRASGRLSPATSRRSSSALTVTMLNRAKKNARSSRNDDDDKTQSAPSGLSKLSSLSADPPGFSDWGPSKRSKKGGFVSAAAEIESWISRAMLSKNEGDKAPLEAVINEFRTDQEKEIIQGGLVGDMRKGPMTWAKQDPNRDIDPSGVMAAAVINLGKAAAMNISYIEFVDRFVKPSREPTVQVILPNRRQLADDAYQLVTAPFRYPVYSILPRVPYCTCWYGVFVEVEATDRDVEITGLFSQSGEYFKDPLDRNNVTVYSRPGPARGFECTSEGWTQLGHADLVRLPPANFTSSSSPKYGRLPMNGHDEQGGGGGAGAPLLLKAGETRSFLIKTSSSRGIVLRAKHQYAWSAGEETERDENLVLRSGLLPCDWDDLSDAALERVFHPLNAAAFVGVVDYRVL